MAITATYQAGNGIPNKGAWLMARNPGGSVATICRPPVYQLATPYMTVPTPSVAMNESILAYSTSTPFTSPMPSPSRRTITTTAGHGTPDRCMPMVRTAQMSMTYPMDRSNWPLAMTMVSPSASSATVDVS